MAPPKKRLRTVADVITKVYRSFQQEKRMGGLMHSLESPLRRVAWATGVHEKRVFKLVQKSMKDQGIKNKLARSCIQSDPGNMIIFYSFHLIH